MNFIRVFGNLIVMLIFFSCNTTEQTSVENKLQTNAIRSETFSYTISQVELVQNTSSASIIPSISLDGYFFQVLPDLPSGLTINTSTGEIQGTPQITLAETEFLIEAKKADDTQYAKVAISIIEEGPKTINYSYQTLAFNKDIANSYSATTTGGTITNYSVTPTLPTGLTIDLTTGDIAGTPTTVTGGMYTITASNSTSSISTSVFINVADSPPSGLSYSNNGQILNVGDSFTAMVASLSSTPSTVAYTITPQLPAGLVLNSDGSISGTPTEALGISTYTVTALNGAGSTSQVINITINNPATTLTYPVTTYEVEQGVTISPLAVQNYAGGTPVTYSCTGCPTGISVNSVTGLITGTTTDAIAAVPITITATHTPTTSTTTAGITINIVENYPESATNIGYASDYQLYEDQATSITPSAAGGMPSSYTVFPDITTAIPGLSFDTTTGVISGTPTSAIATTTFTISGFNLDETSTPVLRSVQSITVTVGTLPPIMLGYIPTSSPFYNATTNTFELQDGSNVALDIQPNITGGGVPTSYSVSPSLPDGVTLNPTTGALTGVPNEITPVRYYTITGTNSSGSYSETLAISTNTLIAPISLSYGGGTNNISFTIFMAGTETPSYAGSQGTFTVSPDLPAGLSLNANTGHITGTPIVAYAGTQSFNITVTNLKGSLTTTIQIAITNIAPAGLVYEDSSNATNFTFTEGDIVTNTDILHSSTYDNNYGAGFITGYAESGSSFLDGVPAVDQSGLLLDTTTGDVTGTALPTDPRELNPAFDSIQIDGTNAFGTTSAIFGLKIIEQAPSLSYNSQTNVVVVQGDTQNDQGNPLVVDPQVVTPTNAGGLIALQDTTGGDTGFFCTATETNSVNALALANITEAAGATADGDASTPHTAMSGITVAGGDSATAGTNFEFDGTDCSFRFNKTTCFGATGDTKVYNITARNSGNTTGVSTPLTVHFYDGPNFLYQPDSEFSSSQQLVLDGSSSGSSYTPDTTNRCHLGNYTLNVLSDLPTPFSFDASTGAITNSGENILGRRAFVLESVETNSGLNLTQTENISVQSNHIESYNAGVVEPIFESSKFDLNLDGFQDLIIRNTECDDKDGNGASDGPCTANSVSTNIYVQSSSVLGLFSGTLSAMPVLSTINAVALAPVQYDVAKAGVIYVDSANTTITTRSTITGGAAENGSIAKATGGFVRGIVPMQSMTTSFGVIIDTGTAVSIDQYTITGADFSTLASATNPTRTIANNASGGIDLGATGAIQVVTYNDTNGDGALDAVIGYKDSNDSDKTKICVLPSDGTDFQLTCSPRLEIPNTGDITDIKFGDISSDTLEEMVVLTNDGTNNTVYVYENQNNTFAGLYQAIDLITLNSNSTFVNFDIADANKDGTLDIVTNDLAGDIDGDSTDDSVISGLSVYYNTGDSSDLYTPTINTQFPTTLHYSNSSGDSNDIEIIPFGTSLLISHCQVDTDNNVITTSNGGTITSYQNSSCGIIGSF